MVTIEANETVECREVHPHPSSSPSVVREPELLAIRLDRVGKSYRRFARQIDRAKQWLFGGKRYKEHWALRDVSLTIRRGQTVGILGSNGSGKSTLLQLLAGTLALSEGSLALRGRVGALLELGSGFHPDFNGWENARLQAEILGLSPAEVEERLPRIAEFSELADALNYPLRTYSSGMIVRLAFSAAISLDPDILLIDEALAVGDIRFQHKCMARIRQLRDRGVTILLVTHDLTTTKRLCDEVHVLEQGRLVQSGPSEPVCNWYFALMTSPRTPTSAPILDGMFRHGDGRATIQSCTLLDEEGQATERAWLGHRYSLQVRWRYHQDVPHPVLGFYLRDRLGQELFGTNTSVSGQEIPAGRAGEEMAISFSFPLRVRPGTYTLCVALSGDPEMPQFLDWIDQAVILEVIDPQPGRVIHGVIAEEIEVRHGV